jgi:hypothetical protein
MVNITHIKQITNFQRFQKFLHPICLFPIPMLKQIYKAWVEKNAIFNCSTSTIFDLHADHCKFFRVDIDIKKFSFECEQKFEIEPEIVDKIVTYILLLRE